MREGLLAFAADTGLQLLQWLMETDVTAVRGPEGKHHAARTSVRHGMDAGSVSLGDRRVNVRRPWMRSADGAGEVSAPADELFS